MVSTNKVPMEVEEEEVHLGSPVTCSKCGVQSFHPFYACKKDCPLTVSSGEKDEIHKNLAQSWEVRCRESKKCANRKITKANMIQHLESHGIRKITVYPEIDGGTNSLGLVSIALPSDMLQSQTEFRWPATKFTCDGETFVFSAVIDPTSNRNESTAHFWVILVGGEKMAKKFEYSLNTPKRKGKKLLCWTRDVHSWNYYDFRKIRSRRETVPIPVKTLVPLCKEMEGKNHAKYFYLEIKMFKNIASP